MSTINVLLTTDVHCSPSGDCIWNNRNSRYYRYIAQKNSCI